MGLSEFNDELWTQLCSHAPKLRAGFGISVIIILLLVVSLSKIETGSATYVIVIVDLVTLLVLAAICGYVVLRCGHDE